MSECSQWNDGHHWYPDDSGDEKPHTEYVWRCDCGAVERRKPEVQL